jgi:hypothetical protein
MKMQCGECKGHFPASAGATDDDGGDGVFYCNPCWEKLDGGEGAGEATALGAGTKCEQCKQLFADGEGDYDDDGSFYCNPCWEQPKDGGPTPPTSPTKNDNNNIRSPSPASTNNGSGGGGGGAYPTWLHGAIKKEQAEELVMQAGGNGTFMVWERKPEANEYVSHRVRVCQYLARKVITLL